MTGHRKGPRLPYGRLRIRRRDLVARRPWRSNGRSWVHQFRRRDSESSVDDSRTWHGVNSVEQLPRCDLLRLSQMFGHTNCRIDETPMQRTERDRDRERENSEIGAPTKRRKMAKRLKFRESISEEEDYFCKHSTTKYIGGYNEKYGKRKLNENIVMNSKHITYEVMYNICYLIFSFHIAIRKIFFAAGT